MSGLTMLVNSTTGDWVLIDTMSGVLTLASVEDLVWNMTTSCCALMVCSAPSRFGSEMMMCSACSDGAVGSVLADVTACACL